MQIKYKGCDISHHQGIVDFAKLKKEVDFVIIKLGGSDRRSGGMYIDNRFEQYYKACKQNNIPVGCYWFAGRYSMGIARALDEVEYVRKAIKDLQFEMPVYLDYEYGDSKNRVSNTTFAKIFCESLETYNYYVGIYASDISGFKQMLDNTKLGMFTHWVARYGKEPTYIKRWDMWQYSSKGKLQGISGNVDLDYCRVNFPRVIKAKHLNGF